MKPIEELLKYLGRPEVLEFGLVTNRLPSVNIGGKFEPVDDEAPTTDVLLQMLVTMGGSRYIEALNDKPVQWTTRLDGVGVIAVAAIMRKDVVQARFTVARREVPPSATAVVPSRPEPYQGNQSMTQAGPPAVRGPDPVVPANRPGGAFTRTQIGPAAPPAQASAPGPKPAAVIHSKGIGDPISKPMPAASPPAGEWDDDDEPTVQTQSPAAGSPEEALRERAPGVPERRSVEPAKPGKQPSPLPVPPIPRRDPESGPSMPVGRAVAATSAMPITPAAVPTKPERRHPTPTTVDVQAANLAPPIATAPARSEEAMPSTSFGGKAKPESAVPSTAPSALGLEARATPSGAAPGLDAQAPAAAGAFAFGAPAFEPAAKGQESRRLEPFLALAVDARASDLHVVADRPVLLRIATDLVPAAAAVPAAAVEQMVRDIVPARLSPLLETEGAVDFALDHPTYGRFRVNASRQRTGYKLSMRVIPRAVPTIASLGLPEGVAKAASYPQGLVLVTGPTGHGKTTTMAAIVDLINGESKHHILTVEDPVEIVHLRKTALMSQREVGRHARSFASALKASLREDPDVIVVGELRDAETVRMAVAASETGHLVIGTMNTPSAAKTIDRLIDLFPPAEQAQVRTSVAGALRLVIGQRLVPSVDRKRLFPAVELLPSSVALYTLIRDAKTYQIPSLQQRGKALGVVRLDESLAELVRAQKVTLEVAKQFAESPSDIDALLGRPAAASIPVGRR